MEILNTPGNNVKIYLHHVRLNDRNEEIVMTEFHLKYPVNRNVF